MSLHPRLRMIKVVQRDGVHWQEFGYHFVGLPGLAVNMTERGGSEWWTLTHLATGHTVGVVVASKERAERLGEQLADIDWRPMTYPAGVVAKMHARVREVAVRDGLVVRHLIGGAVEFLDPALASLEAEQVMQRQRREQEARAT